MPGLGIAGHLINCSYAWIEPMMWITKRVDKDTNVTFSPAGVVGSPTQETEG